MALIACPECQSDVSDRAATCPKCGVQIATESKVIVAAPVQAFLINPKILVTWNDQTVARLAKGEMVTIPVETEGRLTFSAGIRSASVEVRPGQITRIQLTWDRVTGKLLAREVELLTSANSQF